MADAGSPFASFDPELCALQVSSVSGDTKYWTCSEAFNDEYLKFPTSRGSIFVQPYLSVAKSSDGTDLEFFISVPIGDVAVDLYSPNSSLSLPLNTTLDAIESITFIPRLEYKTSGNFHTVTTSATPSFTYLRNRGYLPDGLSNTRESVSGGPVAVHQTYLAEYVSVKDTATSFSCKVQQENGRPLQPLLAQYFSLTSNCNVSSRTLVPTRVREDVGGLEVLPSWSAVDSMTSIDLDQLQAFNWFITISFPTANLQHTPQVGYSLKWAFVQFFVLAYVFQYIFWMLRGLLVKEGAVDVNAYHRRRILGVRD